MKTIPTVAGLALVALLAGCNEEDENHTIEYFKQHPAERLAILKSCEVSDRSMEDANCVNAEQANAAANRDREGRAREKIFGDTNFD